MRINKTLNYNFAQNANSNTNEASSYEIKREISDGDIKTMSNAYSAIVKGGINFQAKKFIPQEIMQKIIELFKNGESYKNISIAIGGFLSTNGVFITIKALENYEELKLERENATTPPFTDEQIIELYSSGMGCKEIGDLLGCHRDTVRNRLKKLDNFEAIQTQHEANYTGKKPVSEEDTQKIINLYTQGYTQKQINEMLKHDVWKILTKLKNTPEWENIKKLHDENFEKTQGIMPQEKTELALKLYKEGESFKAIGEQLGILGLTISRIFKERPDWAEIKAEHDKRLQKFDKDKIAELYKQGKSYDDIAKEMNCSMSHIRNIIKKHPMYEEISAIHNEVCYSKSIEGNKEFNEKVIKLYKEGYTYREIAKELNCAYGAIGKVLRNAPNPQELRKSHFNNIPKGIKTKEIDTETENKIIEMYKNRASTQQISETVDLPKEQVYKILQKQPDWKSTNPRTIQENTFKEILNSYKNGDSLVTLSHKFNHGTGTIEYNLKKHPDWTEIRKEHFKNQARLKKEAITLDVNKIIDEYKAGMTLRQLSNKHNRNVVTILKHIRNNSNYAEVLDIHNKNYKDQKTQTINEILTMYHNGYSIKDLQTKYGYTELGIKRIIQIRENQLKFSESAQKRYDDYTLEELETRVYEFYINNELSDETLENVINFLDTQPKEFLENNKDILIGLCRDLDTIEKTPRQTNIITANSPNINTILRWIETQNKLDSEFETLNMKFADTILRLQSNQLFETCSLLEELIPEDKNNTQEIDNTNKLLDFINEKLSGILTNSDKKSLHDTLLLHYYLNSKEEENQDFLNSAIENYNKIYHTELSCDEFKQADNDTQLKLAQILRISKALDENITTEFDNEYQLFIDLFKDKDSIRKQAISSLIELDNHFDSSDSQKYFLKNFEPVTRKCILDQSILKLFMEKIYKYEFNEVGTNQINIQLCDSVLTDNIWTKKLNEKEKSNFLKTLEYGNLDLNPRSKGRINIIKGEGKIEKGGKRYQIVELKIDSQWRILGYQDPSDGKRFIFDSIALDDGGVNNYKKNFFKTHEI